MSGLKIDPSLLEVRKWREDLQEKRAHLSLEAAIQEIRHGAEDFARAHGLKRKYEKAHEPAMDSH